MSDKQLEEMKEIYSQFCPGALTLNQYDLVAAIGNGYTSDDWIEFFDTPQIKTWYEKQVDTMTRIAKTKALSQLGTNTGYKAVGTAQEFNALTKAMSDKESNINKGPAFVYTYVPLNDEQIQAPNVQIAKKDLFADKEPIKDEKNPTEILDKKPETVIEMPIPEVEEEITIEEVEELEDITIEISGLFETEESLNEETTDKSKIFKEGIFAEE